MQRLNLKKKLLHATYGANKISLLRIHRALIKSKCDYDFAAFASAIPTAWKWLPSVRHAALCLVLGALRSTPINHLLYESEELPVDLYYSYIFLKFHIYSFTTADLFDSAIFHLNYQDIPYPNSSFHSKITNIFYNLDTNLPPLCKTNQLAFSPAIPIPIICNTSLLNLHSSPQSTIQDSFQSLLNMYSARDTLFKGGAKK